MDQSLSKTYLKNYRVTVIILILAAIASIIYIVALKVAYPVFQNTRLTDALAEIHSLFPLYFLAVAIMAILAAMVFIFHIRNRGLYLFLLLLFAVMLWYTRYYLAGFTWEPDSARNLGISLKIPDVLNGLAFPYSNYGSEYPISNLFEYTAVTASGVNYVTYLHIIPLINIILFTLLVYLFANKLFSPGVAFLTTFVSAIGMHYVIFIMGEHTFGLMLLLMIMTIIRHRGIRWKLLAFLLIPLVVMSHPISPLLLGIFLVALLVSCFFPRRDLRSLGIMGALLLVCLLGWFIWPLLYSSLHLFHSGSLGPVSSGILSSIIPPNLDTAQQYTLGNAFIYTNIYNLNKTIYMIYGVMALATVGIILMRSRRQFTSWRDYLNHRGGLSRPQLMLIICVPLFLLAAILLAENSHDLIERALTLAIFAMSGIIVSITFNLYDKVKVNFKKLINYAVIAVLLLLTLSFPIITYSIDAYSSFPLSEKDGLEFIAENISLRDKALVSSFRQQMTLFQPETKEGSNLPSTPTLEIGDVFVLRRTGYYYAAMRYDFSFTNNRETRFRDLLSQSSQVRSIYYNPSFAVFMKTP